jgi:hypothetical protein
LVRQASFFSCRASSGTDPWDYKAAKSM